MRARWQFRTRGRLDFSCIPNIAFRPQGRSMGTTEATHVLLKKTTWAPITPTVAEAAMPTRAPFLRLGTCVDVVYRGVRCAAERYALDLRGRACARAGAAMAAWRTSTSTAPKTPWSERAGIHREQGGGRLREAPRGTFAGGAARMNLRERRRLPPTPVRVGGALDHATRLGKLDLFFRG